MTIRPAASAADLIESATKDFAELANELLAQKSRIRVLLTGGTLGIGFIAQIGKLDLAWDKMFLMFSDERFVPLDHSDRNEHQALQAFPGLAQHLVRFPDPSLGLLEARDSLNSQLVADFGSVDHGAGVFDLTVLGMGPDAHIASLFPGHNQPGEWVIAEDNSPKPPSERLSLTYEALNRSERVWFLAAGEPKVQAVKQSLEPTSGLPAAQVRGIQETVWYLDAEITDAL